MKAKRFNLRKPWFTKGLAKSIRKKNKLYQSFLKNPNSSNENAYKSYKRQQKLFTQYLSVKESVRKKGF